MKKEDFKNMLNPVYLKKAEQILKNNGFCKYECKICPFTYENNAIGTTGCPSGEKIKMELAEDFIKMVEDEIKSLEEFFHGKFENGVLVVMSDFDKGNFENKQEEKMQEFNVGDRVRIIVDDYLKNEIGILRFINNNSAIVKFNDATIDNATILFRNLEKIEEKTEIEPFELEEGMKVKTLDTVELYPKYRDKIFVKHAKTIKGYTVIIKDNETTSISNRHIDWEATKKLNEVKEEIKEEKYLVINKKVTVIEEFKTFEEAEKNIESKLLQAYKGEYEIAKVLKKYKASIKIESEEL